MKGDTDRVWDTRYQEGTNPAKLPISNLTNNFGFRHKFWEESLVGVAIPIH